MDRDVGAFPYQGHSVEVKGQMAGTAIVADGQRGVYAPMNLLVISDGETIGMMDYRQMEDEASVIERAKALVDDKVPYRHEHGPNEIRTTITGPPQRP